MATSSIEMIRREIQQRADTHAEAHRLVVDYYRIRRRLAYPLPVTEIHLPEYLPKEGMVYPWAIWMSWALRERLVSLGTQAQWTGDDSVRSLARRDLLALARWPRFDQFDKPDLSLGHMMQTLHHAMEHWDWVDGELRAAIREAGHRVVEQHRSWSDEHHAVFDDRVADSDLNKVKSLLHNIPVIGGIGLSLASRFAGHPEATTFARRSLHAILALLDVMSTGHSEGLAYNGYVMDFAADLLCTLDEKLRRAVLDHPQLERLLDQSLFMGVPGCLLQVAELGDVEPRQMPFHASAHAKLLRLRPSERSAWFLKRCDLTWLRSDGLAALVQASLDDQQQEAPPAGAIAGHDALVLRSGWEADDLAVAISASASSAGHVHLDAGSLVIGTAGRWLVTDPGYQQYLKRQERQFTIGPGAHNAPLINGCAQTCKGAAKRVACRQVEDDLWHAAVDTTDGYEIERLRHAVRHVWLIGNQTAVVADLVDAAAAVELTYHWHGHSDAAWWVEDDRNALLYVAPTILRMHSVQAPIAESLIDRQPGSRGQLTLRATYSFRSGGICWWVFSTQRTLSSISLDADGAGIHIDKRPLRAT